MILFDIFKRIKELTKIRETISIEQKKLDRITLKNSQLDLINSKLNNKIENKEQTLSEIRAVLEAENSSAREAIITKATIEANKIKENANEELSSLLKSVGDYKELNQMLSEKHLALQKEIARYSNQARKFKSEIIGLKEFRKKYESLNFDKISEQIDDAAIFLDKNGLLDTIIKLPLHSDNSKELRKLSNSVRKEINTVLENYKSRYTTKSNKTIYHLMIVGLQAEMQLLLYKLSYQKLDETKALVREIFEKYTIIAGEGNKSILSTLTRFISEIEPLYIELVDIEYRYYIYRQREKEEQQAIKEQMKQEAEERKALEAERKKLDKEESKYLSEISRNKELLEIETDNSKMAQLKARLLELELQLSGIEEKKDEITSLTTGKAGYVYIISNLGSFGENVFKIGMTRRLEPQQRIDELGSASVPFKFDVHALIFSNDAVDLERILHKRLSGSRINKINFRKEFFQSDIDSLEALVEEIDPTAEFTKTMYAEEYQQTLAIEQNQEAFAV